MQSADVCRKTMQQMRSHIQTHHFDSREEEIDFFKIIKPRFQSQFIFHLKVYNIEINRPTGSKAMIQEYLLNEFYKLKLFFDSHTSFYHYYRSGETFMDEQYFTRGKSNTRNAIQFLYVDADPNFSTICDYQVARILANEMLSDYLNKSLARLEDKQEQEVVSEKPALAWSESKVALAELVYALHAAGVFSKADIKMIAEYLFGMFNIKMSNIYKMFEEIRLRKKNRTVFLDALRQSLLQRMDRDDEQAL